MANKQERVKYRKSALREVIYQVRFPSILKIDTEAPSQFQELIRQEYPLYRITRNETLMNMRAQARTISNNSNHEFVSVDGKTKVNLTNSFVAISTLDYDRWEVFKQLCASVLDRFVAVYKPVVMQRIGLRYKDVITRSKWGLIEVPWKELINNNALGVMGDLPEDSINRYVMDLEIAQEDSVIEHRHFEVVKDATSMIPTEKSFLIDCDYYKQGAFKKEEVSVISELLHDHSSNFIRSIITDTLNTAMEPERI